MLIKTYFMLIINVLLVQSAVATEVVRPSEDILETQCGSILRTESWSERPEVSSAIATYKEEVGKLKDLFTSCELVWRKMPDVFEGQPFIPSQKTDFVGDAPCARLMHIQDVTGQLDKLSCNVHLLDNIKKREAENNALSEEELANVALTLHSIHLIKNNSSGISTFQYFYSKVNARAGMKDYGFKFNITKPEWDGEYALARFEKIIGNPGAKIKGSLQKAFETLLLTIDVKDPE